MKQTDTFLILLELGLALPNGGCGIDCIQD